MFLEVIYDTPILGWLTRNFIWLWGVLKLLGFLAEQTDKKWDDKAVLILKDFIRYLLPGRFPKIEADEKKCDESKGKRAENKVRKEIRNL